MKRTSASLWRPGRPLVVLGSLVLLWAVPLVAQTAADSLPAGVTRPMITRGKGLFESSGLCFACHGLDGKGPVGPDLTDGTWLHHDGSYLKLVEQISRGISDRESKSGVPMPPRGGSSLQDDEIRAVAAYVWMLSRRSQKP